MTNVGPGSAGNPDISAADAYNKYSVPGGNLAAKAHVGSYYYFMSSPQALCASETDPLVTKTGAVSKMTSEFMNSLEAL